MKQRQQHRDVEAQIRELVDRHEPGELVGSLREFAREELASGYPREALLEDFERVRGLLEAADRDAAEDDVVSVMDALVGWCSPHLKL